MMTEGISFENRDGISQRYNTFSENKKIPILNRILLKTGLVKDEQQSRTVLVVIGVTFIVIAILVTILSIRPPSIKTINIKVNPVSI